MVEELRSIEPGSDKEVVALVGTEPRFISEAYFMKFPFEPGNYYLAGRETIDGREVVKIEYLPVDASSTTTRTREKKEVTVTAGGRRRRSSRPARSRPARSKPKKPAEARQGRRFENEIETALNKVTMVTMWIDPQEYQIVRFTFDNVDWGFLPGRAIVRVDEAKAT